MQETIKQAIEKDTTINIDKKFKQQLLQKLQTNYKKARYQSQYIRYTLLLLIAISTLSLGNASWRNEVFGLFNDLISPFYGHTASFVVNSTIHSGTIESGNNLIILSNSGSGSNITIIANANDKDFDGTGNKSKNTIYLTQTNLSTQTVQEILKNSDLKNEFYRTLEKIIKKHLDESNELHQYRDWPAELVVTLHIGEKNGLINFYFDSYYYEGGAHGETTIDTIWFDNKSQKIISPYAILHSRQETLPQLSNFTKETIKSIFENASDEQRIIDGTKPTTGNFQYFILSGQETQLIIPRYQAAAGYVGDIFITIPQQFLTSQLQ